MHGRQASYPTDKGGRRDALGILLRYVADYCFQLPTSAAVRSPVAVDIPAASCRLAEALEMDEGGAVAADHAVDSYYGDYDNEKMRQVCVGEALQATTWFIYIPKASA